MVNSRAKGAAGEREIAKYLREHGYDGARRGQQFSGANGDPDVIGLPGFHIEVKRVEHLNIEKAIGQSIRDARDGEIPVVFHRKNGRKWLATMNLDDLMKLIKRGKYYDREKTGD